MYIIIWFDLISLGYLLGIGETSCDIGTLFQGSESAKGLITLSVSDLLENVQQVFVHFICKV